MEALRELDLSKTNVLHLKPLRLERLCIERCSLLDSLEGLEDVTLLTELSLYGTNVSYLTPLSKCVNLRRIDLKYSCVRNLSMFKELTELKTIYLNHPFGHVDTSGFSKGTIVYSWR